ncbi:basic blue protein-like [Lolium rigidum]|uniref:basic blue protein-like n=1 Tax=Lolium rigidum TaxID=89674 RepID=UPI001F5D3751|nr:basic blue protein-like [Lolium rigidum]
MAVRRSMSGSIGVVVLRLMLALCFATTLVCGQRDWTVGEGGGWTFGVAGWENGKPFSAGDALVFKYNPGMHNVVEVDEAGYNSCTAGAGARTYTSGNDNIRLSGGKTFYICSFPGHCQGGMKIAVATQ